MAKSSEYGLLTNRCRPASPGASSRGADELVARMEAGALSASELLAAYCALLHGKHGTLSEVARLTGLDRRTVKKHVVEAGASDPR